MASRFALRLRPHLLRSAAAASAALARPSAPSISAAGSPPPILAPISDLHALPRVFPPSSAAAPRLLSTARRGPTRPKQVDIGARARQLQARRLWTYALTFSCIAGFIVIVLNQFQDQLVFYVTPTDAMEKYSANPTKNKFRLGGLVLEGSVAQPASSPVMEFVITDLITDMLVRYQGSLPDLFREGHSVVVEGFVKPFTDDVRKEVSSKSVSGKARSAECYFAATEVLAKHDEKYMPQEVAAAIEKNKKMIEAGETTVAGAKAS
ncbi:cytochrome c-type biogenesis protein CcmE homolog, mitochondrial [Syzygium oleosum]|uniref:cytochrome c-type biogenesis protein CcmE homolog, mitochondrial n=1 Tax=Syzygium oleosum TaxID=219896 RepID=UPI0024BA8E6B|nr:cytochrome c-type biogenesis protein CcmE homolog, mitochondrial [Syzygium oleosum]